MPRTRLALLVCAVAAFALVALAPAAGAAPRGIASFFPPVNAGSTGGQLNTPRAIAVNSSGASSADAGDLYVADSGNSRVQAFDANGNFKFAIGRDVVKPGGAGNLPNNEVQTVTVTGATGGTFLLGDGSNLTTNPVPFDASAATLQSELEEVSAPTGFLVGPGGVSVTGPAGGPWTIEFVGPRSDTDQLPLIGQAGPGLDIDAKPYGLTPLGAAIAVTTVTDGAKSVEKCTVAADCKSGGSGFASGATGVLGGMLSGPQGIAVDQVTGDFYVSEQNNLRISKFSADGTFLRAWGRDVVKPGGTGNIPINEQQTVTLGGSPTSGTFTLRYPTTAAANTTVAIPFNATPAEVQSALESLPAIGVGDVNVTSPNPGGGATAGGPYTVTFQGALADTDVVPMTAVATGLGAGKTVTIATPSEGANSAEVCTVAADCKIGLSGGTTLARGGMFTSTFAGYLAVAPTGAPNAGNVVVADPANRRVQEFDPNGGFVRAWGFDVVVGGVTTFEICTVAAECKTAATTGGGLGQFTTNQPTRVAVDSTGATYTVESATANFRVQKFDSTLATREVFAAGTLSGTSTTTPTDVAITSGDNVLVVKAFTAGTGTPPATVAERRVLELSSAGTLLETHMALAGLNGVNGLGADATSGVPYLSSSNPANRVYSLRLVSAPSGVLGVTAITPHTAQLIGTVNPNGPNIPFGVTTSYRVEYSEDGVSWSTLGVEVSAGKGTDAVGFAKNLTGLKANTLYQTRIVLGKQFTPQVIVTGATFSTTSSRPDVQALSPTNRGDTTATLSGRINPNGQATAYHLEYGETLSYGNTVPFPDGAAGEGKVPVIVSESISGLTPQTTYHFRVVATNASGTSTSEDRAFMTRPTGPQPPDGRAYEMVSPADKIGGVGFGYWGTNAAYLSPSGVGAYIGERFAALSNYGSPVDGDSKHGFTNDWALAERDGDQIGWRSHSPISHPNYQPQLAQFVAMVSASEDLSRMYMDGGNVTPSVFPEMGVDYPGWSRVNAGFFLDWGSDSQPSRWEFFGPQSLDRVSSGPDDGTIWRTWFAPDGSVLVGQTEFDTALTPKAAINGMAGPGDPTWPAFGDLVAGRSIYLADTSGVPADTFAGIGTRELVNTCSGEPGVDRTQLPTVDGGGHLNQAECPAAAPGRDSHLISERGAALTPSRAIKDFDDLISIDGSRVFFMSPDPSAMGVPSAACTGTGSTSLCPPQLYVRQKNPDGSVATRWISKAEPALFGAQSAELTAGVRFEGATPDGSRVFFRTNAPLTVDDSNGLDAPTPGGVKTGAVSPVSSDLYMYEFPSDPDVDIGDGTLTRISAGPTGTGDCNSPLTSSKDDVGALRFASDDGKRIYFTCSAPLPGVADATSGSIASAGGITTTADQTNLYLYDEHLPSAERWRFVTRLPRAIGDGLNSCASTGLWRASPIVGGGGFASPEFSVATSAAAKCVNGTSDGSFINFFTMGRLTADDPASPATGDIYSYDADIDELVRITANQGGAGGAYVCGPNKGVSAALCNGDGGPGLSTGVGRINPLLGLVPDSSNSGDRIAFFQSANKLVPEDEDTGYDVYQWRNGELSLISSGAPNSTHAVYKGNSRDGKNVYFATRDALTWQDTDAVNDIYTARVDGGIEEPVTVACDILIGACESARQAPPATPGQAASTVFAGQGNVIEKPTGPAKCAKGKVKRRGKCVSKGKKGGAKKRPAKTTGRAGR